MPADKTNHKENSNDEWEKEFLKLIAVDEITISCPNFDI